jgi:hypothetical protein
MVGSQGGLARWAGARSCIWTTVWCNRQRWSSTCSTSGAEVLEIFRRRQLFAKSSKCEFGRQELSFLRHCLSREGVSVDPRKVQSIVQWATPTSCCEVWRFTGLAKVAAPLTALGSPTARFAWSPAAQASFNALKLALSSAPVLCTFDPARSAVLTTDASNVAVAAILTQPDDEGHQHPVAYMLPSMCYLARRANAPRQSTAARVDSSTPCRCHRCGVG